MNDYLLVEIVYVCDETMAIVAVRSGERPFSVGDRVSAPNIGESKIVRLRAYGHELQEVEGGLTALLELNGTNLNQISPGVKLRHRVEAEH